MIRLCIKLCSFVTHTKNGTQTLANNRDPKSYLFSDMKLSADDTQQKADTRLLISSAYNTLTLKKKYDNKTFLQEVYFTKRKKLLHIKLHKHSITFCVCNI